MGILDTLKESLALGISDFMKSLENELSRHLLRRVYRIKRQIMKELLSVFILLISFVLLSTSAVFFLIEYMHLSKALSFLIIGIIILIIGILLKSTS